MCNKAVEKDPCSLEFVPDWFKTQGMCNKVVEKDLRSLIDQIVLKNRTYALKQLKNIHCYW